MDTQVIGTNDCSIASKRSMVAKGYFRDELIQHFSPKLKRRSPLINIGYCVRAIVVDEGISFFLKKTQHEQTQIVSLGAGFDTTYFRAVQQFPNVTYYEVDFKEVVEKKLNLIKDSADLFKILKNVEETPNGLSSDNYLLLAQDMNDIEELKNVLLDAGLKIDRPTLFVSECAITYMEESRSMDIINWASTFSNVVFMTYEQINPDDGFGQVMMNHFDAIDSPLKSVEVYKTKEDQRKRFMCSGYDYAWSIGAFEIFKKALSSSDQEKLVSLEPFDEWEEWHLTSSHYTLSSGTKGVLSDYYLNKFVSHYENNIDRSPLMSCEWDLVENLSLQFYSHSAIQIWESSAILIVGGFGLSPDNKHSRLSQLCLIEFPEMKVSYHTPPQVEGATWDCMNHSCTLLLDDENQSEFILYGGRTSPQNNVNETPLIISISRDKEDNSTGKIVITGRRIDQPNSGPPPRRRHSASKVENGVLIFGGIATHPTLKQEIFDDAWLLTNDYCWIKLQSMPPPRFSHSAAVHGHSVYIVGGIGKCLLPLGDIWIYSMKGECWSQLELSVIPRYSHTSHILYDNLLLVGGVNDLSEKQPGFSIVNLANKNVIEYKLPTSSRKRPITLHNFSSILCPDRGGVLTIGGGGNCFSFGTSFNKCSVLINLDKFASGHSSSYFQSYFVPLWSNSKEHETNWK